MKKFDWFHMGVLSHCNVEKKKERFLASLKSFGKVNAKTYEYAFVVHDVSSPVIEMLYASSFADALIQAEAALIARGYRPE